MDNDQSHGTLQLMEGQGESVRHSIASCLTRVLSSDQHARKQAEEELKALEVTEGDCVLAKGRVIHAHSVVWQSLAWFWLL